MEKLLHTEKELAQKLKAGDSFAFEVIFYKYRDKVKGYACRMVPSQLDPEEIVQEAFVRLWQKRDTINPGKDIQAFLFAIAKNLVLDHLKSAVNRRIYFTGEYFQKDLLSEDQPEAISPAEAEKTLHTLIARIPERRREIFCLSRFEGMSYKQIANKLRISENTVDSQIRHALDFLRAEYRKISAMSVLWYFFHI